MSVLRAAGKRKKVRKLGQVDIIRREAYADLELDAKVELIRALVPLGLLHVQELLDQEVTALAGARYARKEESVEGRRHGSNPGTVGLAGQRVPIRVPRIRHVAGSEIPLRSYEAMRGDRAVDDLLLRRVLYGISCRNYEAAAAAVPGRSALEFDGVPRLHPGQRGAAAGVPGAGPVRRGCGGCVPGREDVRRRDDGHRVGHHDDGGEVLPRLRRNGHGERNGADTVPAVVGRAGPRPLPGRAGDPRWRQGLRTAVRKAFRNRALVQRCQWHKRENVVSYLARREQATWRQRLQRAYNRPIYTEALGRARDAPSRAGRSEPISGRQPGGRPGRDSDVASLGGVRGAGPVAENDELSGVCQWAGGGTVRKG